MVDSFKPEKVMTFLDSILSSYTLLKKETILDSFEGLEENLRWFPVSPISTT